MAAAAPADSAISVDGTPSSPLSSLATPTTLHLHPGPGPPCLASCWPAPSFHLSSSPCTCPPEPALLTVFATQSQSWPCLGAAQQGLPVTVPITPHALQVAHQPSSRVSSAPGLSETPSHFLYIPGPSSPLTLLSPHRSDELTLVCLSVCSLIDSRIMCTCQTCAA